MRLAVADADGAPDDGAPAVSQEAAGTGDLFRDRLIEFGETRSETQVSVRPEVREELVFGRSVGRRVERVEETIRHTEVQVENLPPRPAEQDPETARGGSERELSGEPSEGE